MAGRPPWVNQRQLVRNTEAFNRLTDEGEPLLLSGRASDQIGIICDWQRASHHIALYLIAGFTREEVEL
jgi:hypothetical protein